MKCPLCKKEQTVIVRIMEDSGVESQNTAEICENPECSFYIDASLLKNWIIRERPRWKRKEDRKKEAAKEEGGKK